MRIIIDTDEKARWRFPLTCTTVVRKLPTGDYSLEGHESLLCVERKSLNDLVKTVIHDWVRFTKQLRRMAAMECATIIVEAPVTALFEKKYEGEALPQSVRGKLNAILLDFGITTMFLDNREVAAEWCHNLFTLYLEKRGQ